MLEDLSESVAASFAKGFGRIFELGIKQITGFSNGIGGLSLVSMIFMSMIAEAV